MARKLKYNEEEGGMAKAQLQKIEKYASKLNDMIHPEDELEGWVQNKLSVVAAYMGDVKHYLDYALQNEPEYKDFAEGGMMGRPRYWEVEFTWSEADDESRKVNVMADSISDAEKQVTNKFAPYYKGFRIIEIEEDKEVTWEEYANRPKKFEVESTTDYETIEADDEDDAREKWMKRRSGDNIKSEILKVRRKFDDGGDIDDDELFQDRLEKIVSRYSDNVEEEMEAFEEYGFDGFSVALSKKLRKDTDYERLMDELRDREELEREQGYSKGGKLVPPYIVSVFYGGEMEDEIFEAYTLEEAKRLASKGEHAEIYDTKQKKDIEFAKGGKTGEKSPKVGDDVRGFNHKYGTPIKEVDEKNKRFRIKYSDYWDSGDMWVSFNDVVVDEDDSSTWNKKRKMADGGMSDRGMRYDIEWKDVEGDTYEASFDSLQEAKEEIKKIRDDEGRIVQTWKYRDGQYVGSFANGGTMKYEGSTKEEDFEEAEIYIGKEVWDTLSTEDKINATNYLKAKGVIGYQGQQEDLADFMASQYAKGGSLYRGMRPSPSISATAYPKGFKMIGNDGNLWEIVVDSRGVHRWGKSKSTTRDERMEQQAKIREAIELLESIRKDVDVEDEIQTLKKLQ